MHELEYKALRRDMGLCQECSKKCKYVHADVVKMISIDKGYKLDNLVSLCNQCSIKYDKKINKKKKNVIKDLSEM